MTRLAILSSYFVILTVIPNGFAGPACAKKNWQKESCMQRCKGKWGYPGLMMGSNPSGSVIEKTAEADWDAVIAAACGMPASSTASASASSATVAGALGNSPSSFSSAAVSATQVVSSSTPSSTTVITNATLIATSSIASSSTPAATTSQSSVEQPSSTSTSSSSIFTPVTTSSIVQEPTTSSTPAPAPTTSASSDSNSNSNSDSSSSSSGTSQSSNSGATSASDIQAYLSGHNTIRAQHGAAPLTWSDDAAAKAQQWANGCVFQHSGGSLGPFGENLAAGTGDGYGIPQALKSWSDESSQYSSGNPQPSHFTQMVWKETTQVGCALQSCSGIFDASFGLAKFYVCEYSPQGNVIGQFAQNVQA